MNFKKLTDEIGIILDKNESLIYEDYNGKSDQILITMNSSQRSSTISTKRSKTKACYKTPSNISSGRSSISNHKTW